MKIWGKTDIGKLRQINQDNFYTEIINQDIAILCVCDGMGGQKAGHIASKYALNEFIFIMKQGIKDNMSDLDIKELLEEAVLKANKFVYEMAVCEASLSDMGTTLIGGLVYNRSFYVSNTGDSRCYHIASDKITQVTKDHSFVQQLIDTGKITISESYDHPKRNVITKAIGIYQRIKSDIYKIKLEDGEYILLCSDGLYNHVNDDSIKHKILVDEPIDRKCEKLIDIANLNGGYDNITAVVLQF